MTSFYKAFEDRFRGSRDIIIGRLKVYLPLVEPLRELYPKCKAVDLGCGRGEWLEVLSVSGFNTYGVDIDEGMLNDASKLGLSVGLIDALEFLKSQPDESISIVSGFHLAEHVAFEVLQELVRQSLRVLKPAGLLILETPNPENISVGSNTFYLDPSHIRPLPPPLLAFLPEFYGFVRTTIFRLNSPIAEGENISLLNVINGASPDYSVVAQKSAKLDILKLFDNEFNRSHGVAISDLATSYDQANPVRGEMEIILRSQVQREQEVAEQLLAIQLQSHQELTEQVRSHNEQERVLQCQYAERELALGQQLQIAQQEFNRVEQDRAQREKELAEQASQIQQKLENFLHIQVQREQEVAAQLLAIQLQSHQELTEQTRRHNEQECALQHQHAERVQDISLQLQTSQRELGSLEQDQMRHDQEVASLRNEYKHLVQASTALQVDFKAQIQSEQQVSLQLRRTLIEVQQSLAVAHASLTWRMIAPFRKIASLFTPKTNQFSASQIKAEVELPQTIMLSPTESVLANLEHLSNEDIMFSSSTTTTTTSIPQAVLTTLGELLAYHDQQFVQSAYQVLLGRQPDNAGRSYYLGRLRAGTSKLQIIMQLRMSKEGCTRTVNLPGLDVAIQRYQRGLYPLLGPIFRLIYAMEGNNPTERKLRAIEQQISIFHDEIRLRCNQMEMRLADLCCRVAQQQPFVEETLDGMQAHYRDHNRTQSVASNNQESGDDNLGRNIHLLTVENLVDISKVLS